jgi:hypothetical protein
MQGEASSDAAYGQTRDPGTFDLEAHATLFGFEQTPARATVIARGRGWRVGGAARTFGISVVIAPIVAIFPPHAVWLIGALVAGALLARRRYIECFTLVDVEGTCPRCGTTLGVKSGRLEEPHPLPCEACHHESSLRIPLEALVARAVE